MYAYLTVFAVFRRNGLGHAMSAIQDRVNEGRATRGKDEMMCEKIESEINSKKVPRAVEDETTTYSRLLLVV